MARGCIFQALRPNRPEAPRPRLRRELCRVVALSPRPMPKSLPSASLAMGTRSARCSSMTLL
eukprot:1295153-Pyramimonas_sp.AAC.1